MLLRLSNIPEPILCESLASWIQRVCQIYDLTFARFYETFEIEKCNDPDLSMTPNDIERVASISNISISKFKFITNSFCRLSGHPPLHVLLLFQSNGPLYRYCARCLAEDGIPFLRLEWRFSSWVFCPLHKTLLCDACPNCKKHLAVHRSILGGTRKPSPVLHLAYCLYCRSDLRMRRLNHFDSVHSADTIETQIRLQRALVSMVLHGHFSFRANSNRNESAIITSS